MLHTKRKTWYHKTIVSGIFSHTKIGFKKIYIFTSIARNTPDFRYETEKRFSSYFIEKHKTIIKMEFNLYFPKYSIAVYYTEFQLESYRLKRIFFCIETIVWIIQHNLHNSHSFIFQKKFIQLKYMIHTFCEWKSMFFYCCRKRQNLLW